MVDDVTTGVLSLERFAEHLRSLGYQVSDEAAAEMWTALPRLQAMRERIRRRFDYADEPAHIFQAGSGR